MISKLAGLVLAMLIFCQALIPLSAVAQSSSCENGECIPALITRLQNLNRAYRSQCLPEKIKDSEIKNYHEENGLSEECWKMVTEVSHLEKELLSHQNRLETRLGCTGEKCLSENPDSLNAHLKNLGQVEEQLTCSPQEKQRIADRCSADRSCAFYASAMGINGYMAELMLPAKAKPKGCHLGNDSCFTQIGTAFLERLVFIFDMTWDVISAVAKKAGKKLSNFWKRMTGQEDHSSTSQLALAKASENPGFFKQLTSDFPGTMAKVWHGFLGTIEEWLKNDVFCEKWSGAPHLSTCQEPTKSFDCISCKAKINGICASAGLIISEVIPSFLTGGLFTAAKYGARGAKLAAKSIRISSKGRASLKQTQLGKHSMKLTSKLDDTLKVSSRLKHAKGLVQSALNSIRAYYLTPARQMVKTAFTGLNQLARKGGLHVAVSGTKKVLIFSGKSVKFALKAVLYPIDNPMTVFAFKAGQRSFEKLMKMASPKLAHKTGLVVSVVSKNPGVETVLAKIEAENLKRTPSAAKILSLEEDLLKRVTPIRKEILTNTPNPELDDVIRNLYPELQYRKLSESLPPAKIVAAEKELLEILGDSPQAEKLQKYIVLNNSLLSTEARAAKGMLLIERASTPKLTAGIEKAHNVGQGGVYEYSFSEIREKYRILRESGFTRDEADELIRSGIAGKPPGNNVILRKGEYNMDEAHRAITHDLFNGEIVSIRRFSENDNRNELFLVMLKGKPEREAIFKPRQFGDKDGWARTPMEYVTYHLNQKLGMDYIPPTAYRKGMNLQFEGRTFTEGAFVFKAPNFTPMQKMVDEIYPIQHEAIISDHRVLSVLMKNGDGHHRNLGLGKHWVDGKERPVFLDWNASLRADTKVFMDNYPVFGNSKPVTKIRQHTLDNLKNLKEDDFKTLVDAQFITRDEVIGILGRRDEIVRYFEELAAKNEGVILPD